MSSLASTVPLERLARQLREVYALPAALPPGAELVITTPKLEARMLEAVAALGATALDSVATTTVSPSTARCSRPQKPLTLEVRCPATLLGLAAGANAEAAADCSGGGGGGGCCCESTNADAAVTLELELTANYPDAGPLLARVVACPGLDPSALDAVSAALGCFLEGERGIAP